MRLAWVLLALAPLLLLEGFVFHGAAWFASLRGTPAPYDKAVGFAGVAGGIACGFAFVGLSLRYGRRS